MKRFKRNCNGITKDGEGHRHETKRLSPRFLILYLHSRKSHFHIKLLNLALKNHQDLLNDFEITVRFTLKKIIGLKQSFFIKESPSII